MFTKKTIALLTTLLFLGGCATAYQEKGLLGGYSETQLDENIFVVRFVGNSSTSKERATAFTLLRSAELTVNHGYSYFSIIDSESYSTDSTFTTPMTAHTTANVTGFGNNLMGTSMTTFSGGDTISVSSPTNTNTIVMFKDRPDNVVSYNAKFMIDSIKKEYGVE
ncbi:hypothetical protein V6961_004480 [Vibrio parahaemolyticus]|uniref:CC0125/CC1285 family lipoprotein n=1 Tax=Vibrio harveyi group TaxID=717610 RepID=UPI0009976F09|nr:MULTISPECIES: hypothetical protein [Vibrio harveyi group]EJC7061795.1 hypothetical protein [Vibrio parahaemolyticus]EJE4711282.1 hypothetical protein [Vibrio parahaemolyticus]EJG1918260.1 hypothetical protein [Vibrio parahaemolyticus]MCR9944694.1 hypothetical protein [Vibrio owensii]OOX69736.1 hypothetical protein BJL74_22670 [Vibrio parahaemolyticus]